MYCPKCKVEVGNVEYCENCGAATVGELKNEKPGASRAAEEIAVAAETAAAPGAGITIKLPDFSIKNIIALGLVLVVLIAGVFGYNKLKALSTPEATAERYAQSLIAGDTNKAFEILDIKESEFLSKENYKKYIESLKLKGKELKEVRPAEAMNQFLGMFGQDQQQDPSVKPEQIKYFEVQIDSDVFGLTMVQKGKSFGIFKGWKVQASDFTKEWHITAPKGCKLSVDGVQVERVEKSDNAGTWGFGNANYKPETVTYMIDGIFPGEYEVTATMEGAAEFKTKATPDQMTTVTFAPTDATIKELHQVAKSFLDLAYSQADKSKYSGILSPDSSLMQQEKINITGGYGFYSNDTAVYKLDSVDVVDKTGVIDDESHAKLQLSAKVSVTTDELVSWFSSETKKVTNQQTTTYDMYFVKKDGKWLVLEPGSMGW